MADSVRVLIADDDPLVRVGLSLVLGAAPEVEIIGEASDGAEAVDMARRLKPDVVLMDVRMPRMDGLAATEALRRDGPEPAIIVLTTFDTDEYLLGALRLGANGFLLKDIAPTEILSAVRRAAAGESILAPAVLPRLIDYAVGRATGGSGDGGSTGGSGSSGSSGSTGSTGSSGGSGGSGSGGGRDVAGSDAPVDQDGGGVSPADSERRARAAATLRRLSGRERIVAEAVATGRSNAEIGAELHMSIPTVKAYVSRLLDKLGCSNRVQIAILIHEAR
ncbi:response regulator transcription factor [Actinoplanes sp. NPDC026670]|uniref:response regulator transcription factor n=1 Tax=Actinoplanes sp. NPDC026670 TaxID=3154700 RepID=UPI0033FBDE05